MTARIIDGQAIAADLRGKVADAVHRLTRDRHIVPGLAVVLVGNNPASQSCWRWSSVSIAIRPCTASWCSCRCRRRSMRAR